MGSPGSVRLPKIGEEMRVSCLDYGMTVVAHALPDIRDGLKLLQPRIL